MLSAEKARHLLRDVQFPGDEDNTYRIAVSGKQNRRVSETTIYILTLSLYLIQSLIRAAGDRERRIAGAIEIQRLWRGLRTRFARRAQ